MKSKLVIFSLLLAGTAMTVNAQTKEKYVSEKASDNIFVSASPLLTLRYLWVSGSLRFGVFVLKVVCGKQTLTRIILMENLVLLVLLQVMTKM